MPEAANSATILATASVDPAPVAEEEAAAEVAHPRFRISRPW